jgi:hypothetical protein
MHPVALLLTVLALSADPVEEVQYGWEPAEDGHLVYIIQITPELMQTLSKGTLDLVTDLPPEVQPYVKKIKVAVGVGPVKREGLKEAQAAAAAAAAQEAALNGQRPGAFNKPGGPLNTNPRGAPMGNRVLQPPGRDPLQTDPPLPNEGDRFTDGSAAAFPNVARTPGIGRTASTTTKFGDAPGDRTPLEYDAQGNPRPAAGTATNDGYTWDPITKQWRAPLNAKPAGTNAYPDQDPRYAPNYPQNGYGQGAYNYNQPPRTNPNAQWNQPPYYPAPLRDPDQGYYPPNNYVARQDGYDPNYPMNRQVGYEVATARQPNTPNTNPPGATAATPAPGGAANPNAKPGVTPTSARDLARYEEANKPWWPLTFTAMLLFASVGLNFYLGWIAHGVYQRYRALLMEVRNVRVAAV